MACAASRTRALNAGESTFTSFGSSGLGGAGFLGGSAFAPFLGGPFASDFFAWSCTTSSVTSTPNPEPVALSGGALPGGPPGGPFPFFGGAGAGAGVSRKTSIFFAVAAWMFEHHVVHWTQEFVLALLWLVVVLSIGSIGLLYWLIRRSAATSVASLFYLVPAVTAAMAYVLFGERLDLVAVVGMVACAAAVFLVNRRA